MFAWKLTTVNCGTSGTTPFVLTPSGSCRRGRPSPRGGAESQTQRCARTIVLYMCLSMNGTNEHIRNHMYVCSNHITVHLQRSTRMLF